MYRTGQLKRKPYSQMWRYRDEAARFEKLQSQYLYLCKHTIRSVEELQNRKEDISICMDTLDEQRHQIYKKRYPHKPALALLKIIEENEIRASYYKEGSTFYAPNYKKWKEAVDILVCKGYTVSQITEAKEAFQRELASVTKEKRELKKEEKLINDILSGSSRVQVVEKIMPALEAKENTKEILQKGGDTEKTEISTTEIPAQTDTNHLQEQPAHNDKQKQPEQAR